MSGSSRQQDLGARALFLLSLGLLGAGAWMFLAGMMLPATTASHIPPPAGRVLSVAEVSGVTETASLGCTGLGSPLHPQPILGHRLFCESGHVVSQPIPGRAGEVVVTPSAAPESWVNVTCVPQAGRSRHLFASESWLLHSAPAHFACQRLPVSHPS